MHTNEEMDRIRYDGDECISVLTRLKSQPNLIVSTTENFAKTYSSNLKIIFPIILI